MCIRDRLPPGGILVTCSCSHHLSESALLELVAQASLDANRTLRILERRVLHLEIERQALTKESDSASRERLRAVENELEVLRGKAAPLKEKWNKERATIDRVRQLKEEQEALQKEEENANRTGDWEKVAQLRYGRLSQIQKDIEAAQHEVDTLEENPLLKKEIGEDDICLLYTSRCV